MSAKRSEFNIRPEFAGFILALLFILCLSTGCSTKESAPETEITRIPDKDAAEAGSMALYMRGLLYESATNSQPDKAESAYSNALKLNPYNKSALSSLINTLSHQKRYEEAYSALSTYLVNFPESTDLHLYAVSLAKHLKKPAEAALFCQQFLTCNPTNQSVARAAIRFHFEGGNDDEALNTLKSYTSRVDSSEAFKFSIETVVSLYNDQNPNPLQALKCSEAAFEFASNDKERSDVLMMQGYCQLEAAQTNNAIRTFKASYRANPENYIPLAHLGNIYASRPEMLAELKNGRRNPDGAGLPAELILGYAYNTLERPQDAAKALEAYYSRSMRRGYFADKGFYLLLGSTYEEYKAYDKIDRLFKDAICAYPDDPEILNFTAYLWAERDVNLMQALHYINIVLKQAPDNPAYLDTRGWILHKAGRNYEALQQLLKACAADNQEPVILDHTGDVLFAIGNDILALDFWKKSYINDPQASVATKLKRCGEPVPEE